ncbi:hypothetical protein C9374_008004 [Naegleria lovaniensis]|uniref:Uncharacterized protein n=1 Tax=Naegleria lovaniensis TaxID=51637 RepID=A0AA88GKH7_NAELO|nr:uncharacterized protein C9374_008004 [Naegleria lovaniensis]KAG2378856.1 hypothetical protein C9374_008004 [Naegleria lovaniensis]
MINRNKLVASLRSWTQYSRCFSTVQSKLNATEPPRNYDPLYPHEPIVSTLGEPSKVDLKNDVPKGPNIKDQMDSSFNMSSPTGGGINKPQDNRDPVETSNARSTSRPTTTSQSRFDPNKQESATISTTGRKQSNLTDEEYKSGFSEGLKNQYADIMGKNLDQDIPIEKNLDQKVGEMASPDTTAFRTMNDESMDTTKKRKEGMSTKQEDANYYQGSKVNLDATSSDSANKMTDEGYKQVKTSSQQGSPTKDIRSDKRTDRAVTD